MIFRYCDYFFSKRKQTFDDQNRNRDKREKTVADFEIFLINFDFKVKGKNC